MPARRSTHGPVKPPPPEIEIEFAQQLRNPKMAYRQLSATPINAGGTMLRSASDATENFRQTPKSPSSPSFLGFSGVENVDVPYISPTFVYVFALFHFLVR